MRVNSIVNHPLYPRAVERLHRGYTPEPMSGCWLWDGQHNQNGYGVMYACGHVNLGAHQVSFVIHKGLVPGGMYVLHKCDVRCCVNPDHLYAGTQIENVRDMIDRGRQGMNQGQMLGHEAEIIARHKKGSRTDGAAAIARDYGVSQVAVWYLVNSISRRVGAPSSQAGGKP